MLKTVPSLGDILSLGSRIVAGSWLKPDQPDFAEVKVHLMGTATTDMIARAVALACVQERLYPNITQSLFGAFISDVLDPASPLYEIQPDIVIIVSDWRSLVTDIPPSASVDEVTTIIDRKAVEIINLWKRISSGTGAKIIHHFPSPPPFRLTGVAEDYLPASYANQLCQLLAKLWSTETFGVQILDMKAFALEHGAARCFSPRIWYSAKLPIENGALPVYVPLIRSALRGTRNAQKKALVLDLDNTLWGGVIGDDGIAGIKLGNGDAVSEAFLAFQTYVRRLASRGIILAVCSKNDPETARLGFEHPESALSIDDFAAFECSWGDKANGLRNIAKTLNIGLDSLVFVDDNPVECALVEKELPEVSVIHLDGEPADFINQLEAGYWFQFQKYSQDDFGRSESYAVRAAALAEQESATDLPSYLRSLDMTGTVRMPEEGQLERVVQLIHKTNQFNLLTQRLDSHTISGILAKPEGIVLACSLKDKFGDHGLVSVLVAEQKNNTLQIVEWVMSCRVFSRTFEQFIINALIEKARELGARVIVGAYAETPKNRVVADLYPRLGFIAIGDNTWSLDITDKLSLRETFVRSS
ncbi:HAD-IIIC family phosphatase [Gluconobacter cerinus]|uniref:HAD-IIIC family phosphatase n=1 Tax=Gluconobacter cerinus TaxID=38307 RepID=UPI001B8BD228|nr:HAD-IIIC family phosphatase [Gluconobacter cerinus]MBS1033360.1 HAD-IIIC family phosphatase [Gluconobacter cerinus]